MNLFKLRELPQPVLSPDAPSGPSASFPGMCHPGGRGPLPAEAARDPPCAARGPAAADRHGPAARLGHSSHSKPRLVPGWALGIFTV